MIPITQLITTYFPAGEDEQKRTDAFKVAFGSWHDNYLRYARDMYYHIADDGSKCFENIKEWVSYWTDHVTYTQQHRQGVGASLNAGLSKAFETSPIVLYAVDDWELTQYFDITPWVKLLLDNEDVGMVRLGPPHPHLTGRIECFTEDWQGWGLRLDKHGYAFAQRPFLLHKRFIDAYGPFPENCSAMDCEYLYNDRVCNNKGPDIVLALPHPWNHIYGIDLSNVRPE